MGSQLAAPNRIDSAATDGRADRVAAALAQLIDQIEDRQVHRDHDSADDCTQEED